jgi:hypothetical protein
VASEESFWPAFIPDMKFRAAWGQSGRAPGAFDAVRTWANAPGGWNGQPAFFPLNVGNPDLGPERTSEVELGFDGSLFSDRLTTQFTWYHRNITNALFNVRQTPTLGFFNTQLANVGAMQSDGMELTAVATIMRRRDFEWSVGGSVYTNTSRVTTLGGAPDFSLFLNAWIMKDQPIPVIRSDNACVTNAGETGQNGQVVVPVISTNPAKDCIYGPNLPPHTYGGSTELRLPHGIRLNARGEYEGGHFIYDGGGFNAVSRSVRWPGCYDFYTLQESGRVAEATAMQVARCTPATTRSDYWIYPADYFKLRDVSVSIPVPSRLVAGSQSVLFTLSGHNVWKWVNRNFPDFDPETGNNMGFDTKVRTIQEVVPPAALFMASLRVVF